MSVPALDIELHTCNHSVEDKSSLDNVDLNDLVLCTPVLLQHCCPLRSSLI